MTQVKTSITERMFDEIENKLKPLSTVSLDDAARVTVWWMDRRRELIKHFDAYIAKKTFGAFLLGMIVAFLIIALHALL